METNLSTLPGRRWFPVDNAATLYAAARRKHWCRTFRISVILKEDVHPETLTRSLREIMPRFPSFQGQLQDGFFWSYFQHTDALPVPEEEHDYPYRPIPLTGTEQPNFRVLYYKRRVSVESFHSLADGGATTIFLSALLTRYYELMGETIPHDEHALRVEDAPKETETCDAYKLHAKPDAKARTPERRKPYYNKGALQKHFSHVVHGTFRVDDIKTAAAKYELTITEYVTALLIWCFIQTAPEALTRDVCISVPMDLRRRLGTQNVRNFVYMTDISFSPDGRTDVSFEEIAEKIKGELLQKGNPAVLLDEISANVAAQQSKVLRPIPYLIKRAFLKNTYRQNQHSFTTFFSNWGIMDAPEAVRAHIERAEFVLGDTPHQPFGCAALSVNGYMTLTFSGSNTDTQFQTAFFRFMANDGIPVHVESNLRAEGRGSPVETSQPQAEKRRPSRQARTQGPRAEGEEKEVQA